MKCRRCNNEMETRTTNEGKIAICHHCKIKRTLTKTESDYTSRSNPSLSNIPERHIREKKEREVRENYKLMLDAGKEHGPRRRHKKRRKSILPKIILFLIIIALLVGGFFLIKELMSSDFFGKAPAESIKTADTINISTKTFALEYEKHELIADDEENPVLLIYYQFTNKQKDLSVSALSTLSLTAMQNGRPCLNARLKTETPEMINAATLVGYKDSILVCQAFSLTDTSEITLSVSNLLHSPDIILGEETLPI